MKKSESNLYLRAAGMGIIAGLRSMMAPALFSRLAAQHETDTPRDSPLERLAMPNVATALAVMAAGEMIADKLPFTPSRTLPPSVAWRAASGALVGAALFSSQKRSPVPGAIVGAIGAIAATYGAYHLRQAADKKSGLPDPIIALVEDAIAIGGGNWLLRQNG